MEDQELACKKLTTALELLNKAGDRGPVGIWKLLYSLHYKGCRGKAKHCPVAHFLRDQVGEDYEVMVNGSSAAIHSNDGSGWQYSYPVPAPISDFIHRFDSGFYPSLLQLENPPTWPT